MTSKHILNVQVSIRAPCCKIDAPTLLPSASHLIVVANYQGRKWYDCAECHHEQEDHQLLQKFDMVCCCGCLLYPNPNKLISESDLCL